MSDLTGRRPDFHGQNLFFLSLLGLLSASSKLGALLVRQGGVPRSGAVDVDDDPLLAAALGAVAIRERLLQHVGTALVAPANASTVRSDQADPAIRTLLR